MAKDNDPGLGPCMNVLNERQRAFVVAASQVGGSRGWQVRAARMAGYEGSEAYMYVQANRLAHDKKVLAAIKEYALGLMHSAAVPLTAMLLEIASGDIPSTPSEKLKAAAMVFNRIGMPEISEQKISVTHNVDMSDAMTRLQKFAKALDLDPRQLLGYVGAKVSDGGEIVDAEFEEVPEEEWSV
jgi:phage terminase small subunit